MRAIAPMLHYDLQLIAEMSEKVESFRGVRAEVLLAGRDHEPGLFETRPR